MSQLIKDTNYTLEAFGKVRIVMVGTTEPGNIGAAARAMKNMGLNELILVNPKSFPDPEASARASGAEEILRNATIFGNLSDAIKDFTYVVGASSRSRTIDWPSFDARTCAIRLLHEGCNGKAAAVFGPEHSGLTNSDLDHCHALLTIPSDPSFSSLNVAMAVQILTYPEPDKSAEKVIEYIEEAAQQEVDVVAFPEACLCGYNCDPEYWQGADPEDFVRAESHVVASASVIVSP